MHRPSRGCRLEVSPQALLKRHGSLYCRIDMARSAWSAKHTTGRERSWLLTHKQRRVESHRLPIDAGGVSVRRPAPRSHESRARREAVGRPRTRVLPRRHERHDGYFEGQGYQVTWALGHLVTLKEPQDYDPALKKWSLETLPIRARAVRAQADRREGRRQAARGRPPPVPRRRRADLRHRCRPRGRADLPLHPGAGRLRGQAGPAALAQLADRAAIRDAFRRLRPLSDYDALYAAARCRSEADWVVGLNATRYYTVRHRAGGLLWSVGRVQTPVLAMIVRRDDEIRTFKPEPFWELLTRYREVTFKFAGDRFAKEEDAQSRPAARAGPALRHPGRRTQAGARPAAAALRPDRAAAGHEPAVRDVGRRHAQGGPVALRGQADQLPADRLAVPGQRHEGARSPASWRISGPSSRPRSASWTSAPWPSPGGSSTTPR